MRVVFGADGLAFVEGLVPEEWLSRDDACSVIDVPEAEVEVDWVGLREKVEKVRAMRMRPTESRSHERHRRTSNRRDAQASFDALVETINKMSPEALRELAGLLKK